MSVELRAHSGAARHLGEQRSRRAMRWGSWYVAEHRLRTMLSFVVTIVVGSVFNPVMYLFALGVGIGGFIDANSGNQGLAGVGYLTFVGPALLASSALNVAFEESSFPVMGGFKWGREFFAMNATPISGRQIANGVALAALLRTAFTVALFWIFLVLFGAVPSNTGWLAMPAAVLGGLAFGALVMAFAASLENDDGWFAIISRLIIAPMFLFSGTFFPLEQLPVWLQWIGWISPLWHATQLGRVASFAYAEPWWLTMGHVAFLLGLLALGQGLSWRIFARRLAK